MASTDDQRVDYADDLIRYASTRTKDVKAASRALRAACVKAAATGDTHRVIARRVRESLMDAGQEEPKGTASKVATVALWLREGGEWPDGGSLTRAYEQARSAGRADRRSERTAVVCPNCSHSWVP